MPCFIALVKGKSLFSLNMKNLMGLALYLLSKNDSRAWHAYRKATEKERGREHEMVSCQICGSVMKNHASGMNMQGQGMVLARRALRDGRRTLG